MERRRATRSRRRAVALLALIALIAVGCASPPAEPEQLLSPEEQQMRLRNMQTRTVDVADRATAMRAVIAALQDLGFILERANEPLGVVTASRFAEKQWFDVMGVTVTVRMRGEASAEVRINAVYNNQPVTDAEVYRNFFTTLERSLFVERS